MDHTHTHTRCIKQVVAILEAQTDKVTTTRLTTEADLDSELS